VICNAGYGGGGIATCGVDGSFNALFCEAGRCTATSVANSVDYEDTGSIRGTLNDAYNVVCLPGYDGGGTATCGSNGLFNTITCDDIPCPPHSTGSSVAAGCLCDEDYPGEVHAVDYDPFYTTSCALMIVGEGEVPGEPITIRQSRSLGWVTVPDNFQLTFDVTPLGVTSAWSNFLHFTSTGANNNGGGSRMPAVWFHPGRTSFHCRQDTTAVRNDGFDTSNNMPLNVLVSLKIRMVDRTMEVFLDDVLQGTRVFTGDRIVGSAEFWMTDPWYASANALVANVAMIELS
jgi:hypothetical protein